jgi:hypothetical protein
MDGEMVMIMKQNIIQQLESILNRIGVDGSLVVYHHLIDQIEINEQKMSFLR